jgi:iron complex transport system substrate-binding protein
MKRFLSVFLFLAYAASLAAQPQRIVSTAPSITELLYALGLGDKVVGVTTFCNYPPEAKKKPKIGGYTDPNLEAIAALRPDLVIVQNNPVRLTERLRVMKLNVVEIEQRNLAAMYKSFRDVGQAAGAREAAAKLEARVRDALDEISRKAAKLPTTKLTFVVGRSPDRLDGLIVAGRASYLNEVLRIAGGRNIFEDAVASYPAVSLEEMVARNPQVIVDMGDMSDTGAVSEAKKRSVAQLWQRMGTIEAVKAHHVYAVAADYLVVPGPRVVDAARAFFEMLHPGQKP